MQALTKYVDGHSDLLMGSVTVRDETLLERLGETRARMSMSVSPDECSLALRGLQTLAVTYNLNHSRGASPYRSNHLST